MMDPPNSIITQVSRDQEHSQLNSYQASPPNSNTSSRSELVSSYDVLKSLGFAAICLEILHGEPLNLIVHSSINFVYVIES